MLKHVTVGGVLTQPEFEDPTAHMLEGQILGDMIFYNGSTLVRWAAGLDADGKCLLELRPDLDFESVRAHGKPTWVSRGISGGFSLPIFNDDDEELRFNMHVPRRWDGVSDILAHAQGYLDSVNNGKNFKLQLAWEHWLPGTDVVPDTSNPVEVEVATGNALQYQSYHIPFTIDYDIDGVGSEVAPSECLCLRLRRIAASADEISGEFVVTHVGIIFVRDKLG